MSESKQTSRGRKSSASIGTLLLTVAILALYWWFNGASPTTTSNETAQIGTEATATSQPAAAQEEADAKAETNEDAEKSEATEGTEADASSPADESAAAEHSEEASEKAPEESAKEEPPPTNTPTAEALPGPPGMPVITFDELPPEAIDTIELIWANGPFPFDKDDTTFQNREGILPDEPRGYYREFTVITPGARTRGARRIVEGEEGELYYTDDHYSSFYWVEVEE